MVGGAFACPTATLARLSCCQAAGDRMAVARPGAERVVLGNSAINPFWGCQAENFPYSPESGALEVAMQT